MIVIYRRHRTAPILNENTKRSICYWRANCWTQWLCVDIHVRGMWIFRIWATRYPTPCLSSYDRVITLMRLLCLLNSSSLLNKIANEVVQESLVHFDMHYWSATQTHMQECLYIPPEFPFKYLITVLLQWHNEWRNGNGFQLDGVYLIHFTSCDWVNGTYDSRREH